jgi:hypothetical protein
MVIEVWFEAVDEYTTHTPDVCTSRWFAYLSQSGIGPNGCSLTFVRRFAYSTRLVDV